MSVATKDRLILDGMEFFGHHGVLDAERAMGFRVYVDVEIQIDLRAVGRSDSLAYGLGYPECFAAVQEVVEGREFHLIEAIAEAIADELLRRARVEAVRVKVGKQPPGRLPFRQAAVVIERTRESMTS